MNRKIKKTLSLLLCLVMTMAIMAPAAAAASNPYPVVYLEGYGGALYAEDGNTSSELIYPTNTDVGGTIKEALLPCLKELANGLVTDNYDKYADALYNAAAPIWADIVLNKDGTAKDGSGDSFINGNLIWKSYSAELSGYRFAYDWRLSPYDIADELKVYIDNVMSATGKDKVNLVGRCLGGNMITAYLAKHTDHAKEHVDSVMLYVTSSNGIKVLDALFTGEIVLDENNIERFADYLFNNKVIISKEGTMAQSFEGGISYPTQNLRTHYRRNNPHRGGNTIAFVNDYTGLKVSRDAINDVATETVLQKRRAVLKNSSIK